MEYKEQIESEFKESFRLFKFSYLVLIGLLYMRYAENVDEGIVLSIFGLYFLYFSIDMILTRKSYKEGWKEDSKKQKVLMQSSSNLVFLLIGPILLYFEPTLREIDFNIFSGIIIGLIFGFGVCLFVGACILFEPFKDRS